jgi:hypothetical protein
MQTVNDAIAHSLTQAQLLLNRYTADLTPTEYLHRPTVKANCVAWTIGHLILSERRALGALGAGGDLPPLPEGFEKRFSRDEGCPQASEFGDVSVLLPLFNQHRQRLIDAVRRASPEQLNKPLEKPHPMFANVGEMVLFMSSHSAMHAGQFTIIRRSLGRPPLI